MLSHIAVRHHVGAAAEDLLGATPGKAVHKSRLAAVRMLAALGRDAAVQSGMPKPLPGRAPVLAAYERAYGRLGRDS